MTFFEDAKKPYNIFTTGLAFIGIALGVFFYIKSTKNKSISYQISEPSSIIYNSKNSSSKIQVLERIKDTTKEKRLSDSLSSYLFNPIQSDVFLLTGVIWNSGDLPIDSKDVRKMMELNLKGANKILDFKIAKQIDPEVADFALTQKSFRTIRLTWKYFDPGYALKFQIIYTGDENAQFDLEGKILGVTNFEKIDSQVKKSRFSWTSIFNVIICVVFLFIIRSELKDPSSRFSKWLYIIVFITNFVLILITIYNVLYSPSIPIPIT